MHRAETVAAGLLTACPLFTGRLDLDDGPVHPPHAHL